MQVYTNIEFATSSITVEIPSIVFTETELTKNGDFRELLAQAWLSEKFVIVMVKITV